MSKRKEILWIEAESKTSLLEFTIYLQTQGDFSLCMAYNVSDAENLIASKKFDIIISGIRLEKGEDKKWIATNIEEPYSHQHGLEIIVKLIESNQYSPKSIGIFTNTPWDQIEPNVLALGLTKANYLNKATVTHPSSLMDFIESINRSKYSELSDIMTEDFAKYQNLPMAVYISAADGTFVDFNLEAKNIFELKEEFRFKKNILDFYVNEKDRHGVIKKFNELNEEWLRNETLQFKLKSGERRSFRYFAKPYYRALGNKKEWIGSLSLVFEITQFERFRKLEEVISVAMFEIDQNQNISYCNETFARIMGIMLPIKDDIPISDFFVDKKDIENLIQKLIKSKDNNLKGEIVRLKKKNNNDHLMMVQMDIVPDFYKSKKGEKKLLKAKGIIRNISIDNLQEAPLGLYVVMVEPDSGNKIITWANKKFEEIHGFDTDDEYIGKSVSQFHKSKSSLDEFERQLMIQYKKGKDLNDYLLETINRKLEAKELIVNTRLLVNTNKDIIGRVGSIFDISDNVKRQLFREVENDYGAFLHIFQSMLHDILTTLNSIIDAHGTDLVVNTELNVSRTFKTISTSLNSLAQSLSEFFVVAFERNLLKEPFIYDIDRLLKLLQGNVAGLSEKNISNTSTKNHASTIRGDIKEIRDRLDKVKLLEAMPAELWKKVRRDISETLRFARLISLSQIIHQVKDMDNEVEILRRAITTDQNNNVLEKSFPIIRPLNKAISDLIEYAHAEKTKIITKYDNHSNDFFLKGNERNLRVAFYNLLHNAIKYSWKKSTELYSEVRVLFEIKISNVNGVMERNAEIQISNLGVPIHPRELEEGKILKFGYRGVFAKDRNRRGTGVGLWHSKKIITEMKGTLKITSAPIFNSSVSSNYSQPYLTSVKINFIL